MSTSKLDATHLTWLRDALFAPGADVELVPTDASGDWLARPSAAAPELLVPLASRRAAAAVSRRFWDGMPVRLRTRQWLGEAALRSGAAQRWWPGRVALVGTDAADPDRSLVARLAERLGRGPLTAAATLRPTQFNGKPVLQLFGPGGEPVAFAKVAIDTLTAEYVETELHWLERAASAPHPLRAPRVLLREEWNGHPVAVIESFLLPRLPRRRPDGVARAVLALGPVERLPVEATGVVERSRIDLPDLTEAVVQRHLGAEVEVGAWHGDLSPWNTATRGGEVLVWDWELAGEGMPVGSDRRHEAVMVATHLRGIPSPLALADLPVHEPEVALYLLELARRDARARHLGHDDPFIGLGEAAEARLHEAVGP